MTVLNSPTQQQQRTLNRDTGAPRQYHTWDTSAITQHTQVLQHTLFPLFLLKSSVSSPENDQETKLLKSNVQFYDTGNISMQGKFVTIFNQTTTSNFQILFLNKQLPLLFGIFSGIRITKNKK